MLDVAKSAPSAVPDLPELTRIVLLAPVTMVRGPQLNTGECVAIAPELAQDLITRGLARHDHGTTPTPGTETATVNPTHTTHTAMTAPPLNRQMPSPTPRKPKSGAK